MAARANSLTNRVSVPVEPNAPPLWTTPATDLRVMLNGLARLGYDTAAVIAGAGLGDMALDDPDARVSCDAYGAMIACAQQQRMTPNLALALAQQTPLGAYPLLDYLVITSDTVCAGVRQLARYFRIAGNPFSIEVNDTGDPVRIEVRGGATFAIEYLASLIVLHMRAETGGAFAAAHVSFRHTPDDVVSFERALGCPIQIGAPWDAVTTSHDAWRLPLRRRDPVLRRLLESQADEIVARLPARAGLALEVQRALAARVAGGDTRIEAIARHLAVSARTLQRRLAAEGASYQGLLDEARKEAAGRYLSGSTLAIGEIAYLVGYSEPAPFHRAFKRWYGTTPEAFRQRQA